jgi:hypothetical protein
MIDISCLGGDTYRAKYYAHIDHAKSAQIWCYDNWGDNWGVVRFGHLNRLGFGTHDFFFKMMQHAIWFKLKFESE